MTTRKDGSVPVFGLNVADLELLSRWLERASQSQPVVRDQRRPAVAAGERIVLPNVVVRSPRCDSAGKT